MGKFVGSGAKTLATVDLFCNVVLPLQSNPTVVSLMGDSAGTARILRALGHKKKIVGVDRCSRMLMSSCAVIERLALRNVEFKLTDITELNLKKKVDLIDLDWCQTLSPRTLDRTIAVANNLLAPTGGLIVAGSVGHGYAADTKNLVSIKRCVCNKCVFGAPEIDCPRRLSYVAHAAAVEEYIREKYNPNYNLVYSFDYCSDYFSMLYCYLAPTNVRHDHRHFARMSQVDAINILTSSGRFSKKQLDRFDNKGE